MQILSRYVHPVDTALDVGCGMGYFTLPLARLVGREGHAGLLDSIQFLRSAPDRIGPDCALDFALTFWMVHEARQPEQFLQEIYTALKPGGRLLVVEPIIHVPGQAFERTVRLAEGLGLAVQERPPVKFSRAALFYK